MSADRPFDVAIAGAGFAGLALAGALSAALGPEFRVALIDRKVRTAALDDGRASALSASSINMLRALGVWDGIAAEAQPMRRIEITDTKVEDALRPMRLAYDNTLASGDPATVLIPNAVLIRALEAALDGAQGVVWFTPVTISGLTMGDHAAAITLSDSSQIEAALAIAADGKTSDLRKRAGIKGIAWDYGQTGIVATIGLEYDHDGLAIQHFMPGGPFAFLPLTGKRACITWSEASSDAARILALDASEFLAEIDRRLAGRFGELTLIAPPQSWPLSMNLAREMIAPRVAVAGDAAHGVHPIAGQGLNLTLRDIAALAEVIANAARLGSDIGSMQVLESYQRWRRFDVAQSMAAYDGLNRFFRVDDPMVRGLRGAALGVVDRLPVIKQMLVNEAAGMSGELPRLMKGERV